MSGSEKCSIRLDGLGYVVLGTGRGGIGEATARSFAELGAQVLCADVVREEAEAVAAMVGGHAITADLTRRSDMQTVFDKADSLFGDGFSGIVDIVGLSRTASILDYSDDEYREGIDLVLRHALLAMQIGVPLLQRRGGGSVTVVGSQAGERVFGEVPLYGAAKSALHHLVRYAANEFGPTGVRVNAVAPGVVATRRLLAALSAEQMEAMVGNNPLRRPCYPADVAHLLVFLASSMANYVNGTVIPLDGGAGNLLAVSDLGVGLKIS